MQSGFKGDEILKAEDKLEELKANGERIFSFSKLGTFNTCEYEYYNSYVKKNRGIPNIYTEMGSLMHDNIEGIYAGENDVESFRNNYTNKVIELDMLGVKFPSESIGDSWKKDIDHFLKNFKKIDKKMILEKLIVFEIEDGIWLQGYIDATLPSDKGKPYVQILDWKTSSKFSGKKLTEAGRQLLMYKLGIEDNTPLKVDKVMWFMLKYINVCHVLKNKKVKKKMCNRGKWVKEMRSAFEKEMFTLGIEEFELEMLLDKAVEDNEITGLPKEIQDKYWLEDCIVEYEITDEKVEEVKNYILGTIKAIDEKNPADEKEWKPVEIDKYNSFYCSVLCGHRKTCKFYKKFLEENADGFEKKKKKEIDMDDLFG